MGSFTNFLRDILSVFSPSEEKNIIEDFLDLTDSISNNKNKQKTNEDKYKTNIYSDYDKEAEIKFTFEEAVRGNAAAQYNLGILYYYGSDVIQSYTEAVNWFQKAAEQGFSKAQYNLGFCYFHGKGITQSYTEAFNWFQKAAEQGFSKAQSNLGVCYYQGKGITQSYTEAVNWFQKAVEQNLAEAQSNLGECYEYGKGVSQDYVKAANFYRKAAEQGFAEAQCKLGNCYENGMGVEQNLEQALRLYQMSAEQGYTDAQKALDRLSNDGKIPQKEPIKAPIFPKPHVVDAQPHLSQQSKSDSWLKEESKSSNSNTTIIVFCFILLLICGGVGGYFYYKNVYLPNKLELKATCYYTFGNLMLRSSQIAGVDYNKIAMLPYGTKFIIYSHGAEWSKVKVESADPAISSLEGYVSTSYILNPYDFFLLNSIFADAESRDAIPTSKAKLALLKYYKKNNYVGCISDEQMKEAGIDISKTSGNQWLIFVNAVGKNPCEVFYKKVLNKDSKYNDFAVIIKNIVTRERKLLYFYFDDDETSHFYCERPAPSTGEIKNITIGYNGNLIVEYTY